jgi:hypothetical protein
MVKLSENLMGGEIAGELLGNLFDKALFTDWLIKLAIKDQDVVEELLEKWGKNVKDHILGNGTLDLALLEQIEISLPQKFSAMFGNLLFDWIGGALKGNLPNIPAIQTRTFAEELSAIDSTKGVYADGQNMIWSDGKLWDKLSSLWGLANRATQKGENFEDVYLIRESRMVIGSDSGGSAGFSPSKLRFFRGAVDAAGLKLTKLSHGEAMTPPGSNEIQYVQAPDEGMPLAADGKVDVEKLRWYAKLYNDPVGTTWFFSNALLAGIYMVGGMKRESAVAKARLGTPKGAVSSQVADLDGQLKTVSTAAESAVAAMTMRDEAAEDKASEDEVATG